MNLVVIITITYNHCPKTVDELSFAQVKSFDDRAHQKLILQLSEFRAKWGYLKVEPFIPDSVPSGLSI